ncbi:hypothetical protein F3Y22_tig00111582pilonHSYRG00015 [Hibiscus syriacus]|uniref:Uncharacterized protein n=1 Tax=Hibiscus syriacus TaxID=106335 RepID=A0A6A2YGU9_HIBSY|nr:hypothetical protein F3Y22_tig00111582pilonHSYRG00015 [Hibiscus syriacus]
MINEKNDVWVVDYNGVSRSRSLCSFRGSGFFGSEDGGDSMSFSAARSSSISAARSSSVNGGLCVDPERKSGFSEAEPRKSGFDSDRRDGTFVESDYSNRRVFSLRESYFTGGDDSGFIDLKFEFPLESKGDIDTPAFGSMRSAVDGGSNSIQNGLVGDNGIFCGGGSCRVTVNERGIKRSRKSFKGWRWIFRHNQDWSSTRKKNGELMVNH